MDIHDRVSELEARISKLEPTFSISSRLADPSLQPVKRVMFELDAGPGDCHSRVSPFQVLHDQEVDASGGRVRGTDAMKGTEC
jgi:hypothetical protein